MTTLKKLSPLIPLAILLNPLIINAQDDNYLSVQSGIAIPHTKVKIETLTAGSIKQLPKSSGVINLSAGRRLKDKFFLELEGGYNPSYKIKSHYIESGLFGSPYSTFKSNVSSTYAFGNANYQFKSAGLTPYLSAGLGLASNQINNTKFTLPYATYKVKKKTMTTFAWQIGGGVLLPITKALSLNMSYKYRDLGKIRSRASVISNSGEELPADNPIVKGQLRSSNILIGVLFNF
jgi:opacity protein-like surface antigen